MIKITEKLIQKSLYRMFHSHRYRFLNVFFFENESDFLSFMPNGFCYEVEIKISRSDFKADFKKNKHVIHEANGQKFYTQKGNLVRMSNPDWEFCKNFPELVISQEYNTQYSSWRNNRNLISLYFTPYSSVIFREFNNEKLPNKFFYAVPEGLVTKDEVPDYAGLIYIDCGLNAYKVKDAKFIHKEKLDATKVFNKMYYSYEREVIKKLMSS